MKLKIIKRWLPLIILVALMIVAFATGLYEKLSLEVLQDNKEAMLDMVAQHPFISALGFMALYIIFVALSLPAATLLTLAGGFLFGPWLGTLYVVTSATIGATIIFFIAKTSLGTTLREKAGGLYQSIESNMNENATGYLLFMRLVPLFPFFLVNIVPALFNVSLRVYILTTFFGIIPGSFVYVNLGGQLANITSLSDLVSLQTLMAFALLGVFALIPPLYNHIKKRRKTLTLTVIMALSVLSAPQAYANEQYNQFLELYDGLLKSHTSKNISAFANRQYRAVDYDGWAVDKRHKKALALLLAQNPQSYTGEKQKAFWINAYNFLTIELIVREGERKSIKNLGSFFTSPWKRYDWAINGRDYTLDDIEHAILRPMGDARIHFAINCASASCPDIRGEVYKAETLEHQLDDQVKITLGQPYKGYRYDSKTDTAYVSKIFSWFAEDFDNGNVRKWLQDNQKEEIGPDTKIKFMTYSWELNKKRQVEK